MIKARKKTKVAIEVGNITTIMSGRLWFTRNEIALAVLDGLELNETNDTDAVKLQTHLMVNAGRIAKDITRIRKEFEK